jgi:hypothetical protein
MRWEIHPKGSTIGYAGHAETVPITESVHELWRKYIDDAAPKNAETAWDHLRVELWLDSGRIILFPALSTNCFRIEKAACQLICPDLLNFYETLIKAKLPDEKFEIEITLKEMEVAEILSKSAKDAHLPQKLGRPEINILYFGADVHKPIRKDTLRATQCT